MTGNKEPELAPSRRWCVVLVDAPLMLRFIGLAGADRLSGRVSTRSINGTQ